MRRELVSRLLATIVAVSLVGCDPDDPASDAGPPDASAPGPATALADYDASALYAAPWPDERLRDADGAVRITAFPNPRAVRIVSQLIELLDGADGFALSGTVYFPLSAPIDPASLPADARASLEDESAVFLIDVDPSSPDRGARFPIDAAFAADPGPHGAPNLVALLPLQGRPLHPSRRYAAVLTTRVRAADGSALEVAPATAQLFAAERPPGLSDAAFDAHTQAIEALRELEPERADEVAAMAVFHTWDPTRELADARAQLLAGDPLTLDAPPEAREVFDDYCVFHATVAMPDFQGGDAPYESEGGWVRDEGGALEVQREATSNLWITVPRRAMPDAGFPVAVFVRTGGGGDRPLVDRGHRSTAGGASDAPGEGPARHFARAGVVGVSVDGPLGGLRNLEAWDEQFAIFNINNPIALRDSVRQSALELMHLARALEAVSFDASSCPDLSTSAGDGVVALDLARLALMGHSMGATIAPLAVALEPRFRALILSGAGASWIENVIYKESPIGVRPAAEALLQYSARGRELNEHDPALALLQWAGEPADPQVYARSVIEAPPEGAPRHVLMFQGILDTYIPPPVANPLSLALGLDLGGAALDETLDRYAPLTPLLPLAGREAIALPASGNLEGGAATGAVVQHLEDGVEDGHEIVFQRAEPPLQYRCFLETLARDGVPTVVPSDASACPP